MKVLRRNGKRGEVFKPFESRWDFLRDEFENIFERALRPETFLPTIKQWEVWPPLDVIEDETGVTVEVDVPGFGPKELEVEVEGKMLIIRGILDEKQIETPERKGLIRYERHVGNFERTIPIPEYLDPEKIEAKYDKGTLIIRLPRLPGKAPKKVMIKTV